MVRDYDRVAPDESLAAAPHMRLKLLNLMRHMLGLPELCGARWRDSKHSDDVLVCQHTLDNSDAGHKHLTSSPGDGWVTAELRRCVARLGLSGEAL
jgi:hypothetical protein